MSGVLFHPLLRAASRHDIATLERLIDAQANINQPVANTSVLHVAAFHGHLPVLSLLLHRQANVNATDQTLGTTALHVASCRGHHQAIGMLLQHQADATASCGTFLGTPLHVAAAIGHQQAVATLLSHSEGIANQPMHEHYCRFTAMHLIAMRSVRHPYAQLCESQVQCYQPSIRLALGGTLSPSLHTLEQIIALLVAHDADINAPNSNGYSALHLATADQNHMLIAALVQHKADINANYGSSILTPLQLAARRNDLQVVQVLLEHHADATVFDAHGCTALHHAVLHGGSHDMIAALIHSQADVNANSRFSPLHVAINEPHLVSLLLEHRANVNARALCNTTPLHLAAQQGQCSAIMILIDYGADKMLTNVWNEGPA
jgi:ankyrin